jgi:hypothetical protein
MSSNRPLQNTRLGLKRTLRKTQARLRWRQISYANVPVVFGNAMPKSGSHLLLQILQGFTQIGPFVEVGAHPLRTITGDGRERSPDEIQSDLKRLNHGDVAIGYLWATPDNLRMLTRADWSTYFIIRDPRDMLVSHLHYATTMYSGHGMHKYYNQLPTMDERLKVAIRGINEDGVRMAGVAERYARWVGFIDQPEILVLHFEDLITNRHAKLSDMLDHLEASGYTLQIDREAAIKKLSEAINPSKSPTFRKGRSGEWRRQFNEEHKQLFNDLTGDLLIRLGYEEDQNW